MTTKGKKTAPPNEVAVSGVTRRTTDSKHNRALARENPQLFPDVSSKELLSDLEDDSLDSFGEDS